MTDTAKEFLVAGRAFKLFGRDGDVYFDTLQYPENLNDMLVRICESWKDETATVLDIGSNIGFTTSLLANSVPNGKVFSFEPSPKVFPYLIRNIKENNFSHCYAKQVGVGREAGQLSFYDDPGSASASHIVSGEKPLNISNQIVEITTIDVFVADMALNRVDFVKVDVEGAELNVIEGAQKTIERFRPQFYIEFNSFTLIAYGNQNPKVFLERLLDIFPYVYVMHNGVYIEIRTPASILYFIHTNLVLHKCIDDIYCRFDPIEGF